MRESPIGIDPLGSVEWGAQDAVRPYGLASIVWLRQLKWKCEKSPM
jgi:hypothetical protein